MKRAGKVSDMAIFERLAHDFQGVSRKLRQLIEEQDTIVCERDFARSWDDAAANEACIGDGVVW